MVRPYSVSYTHLIDAVANRVRRVATGWESRFTIAIDGIIDRTTVPALCEAFFSLNPPTRIRLRDETLAGTLGALSSGQADLALGVVMEAKSAPGLAREPMGGLHFIFAVAPHHPLATAAEPLSDDLIRRHRAVAVADSIPVSYIHLDGYKIQGLHSPLHRASGRSAPDRFADAAAHS